MHIGLSTTQAGKRKNIKCGEWSKGRWRHNPRVKPGGATVLSYSECSAYGRPKFTSNAQYSSSRSATSSISVQLICCASLFLQRRVANVGAEDFARGCGCKTQRSLRRLKPTKSSPRRPGRCPLTEGIRDSTQTCTIKTSRLSGLPTADREDSKSFPLRPVIACLTRQTKDSALPHGGLPASSSP